MFSTTKVWCSRSQLPDVKQRIKDSVTKSTDSVKAITSSLAKTDKIMKRTKKLVPQLPYNSPQLPYNSVLTPADFFLLQKLDTSFKGQEFQSADEIQEKTLQEVTQIPSKLIRNVVEKRRLMELTY